MIFISTACFCLSYFYLQLLPSEYAFEILSINTAATFLVYQFLQKTLHQHKALCLIFIILIGHQSLSLPLAMKLNYIFLLTLCYYYPRLRRYNYLKPFYISLVWSLACTFHGASVLISLQCFLFLLSLCLIDDLKDAESDRKNMIKTFANQFSPLRLRLMSSILLAKSLLILTSKEIGLIAISSFFAICLVSFFWLNEKNRRESYLIFLDGLIILKPIILMTSIS